MENDKLIIALLVVIVVLLAVAFVMFNPLQAKADSTVTITSNNELYDGDSFTIFLSDFNQTPIANQTVDVVIVDASGSENPQKITTDASGNGALQLNGLNPGEYTVNVSYGGNGEFKSSKVSQTLKIGQATTESLSSADSSSSGVMTIELDGYDAYYSATDGDYKGEAMKWQGSSIGGLGVWLYKNGQLMDKKDYLSRGYVCIDGQWKWTEWEHGEVDAVYHKYDVGNGVIIQKVEISF